MALQHRRCRCTSALGPRRQGGVALAIALIFLVVITLVGLVAMRSSVVELRLAQNTQFEIEATQKAQAVIDAVVAEAENFSVGLQPGESSCYNSGSDAPTDCDQSGKPDLLNQGKPLFQTGVYVEVRRLPPARVPLPAPTLTSLDKFSAASFAVRGQYNQAEAGLGAADIEQGVIRIVPSSSRIR